MQTEIPVGVTRTTSMCSLNGNLSSDSSVLLYNDPRKYLYQAIYSRGSRILEVLTCLGLLAILAPLLLITTILVYVDDKGPVFFSQKRLGLNGKEFKLIKFRSMYVDAEISGPAWASVQDRRVTRVGRLLRLTRVDELPQLWNVLRGEMALIGPRPERAHFAEQLTKHIPLFPKRLLVKPGITGWAQVNLPYGASIEDARAKLAYDLDYISNRNFHMIVAILVRTIGVVVSGSGR